MPNKRISNELNHDPTTCCLSDNHFKYNCTTSLKWKGKKDQLCIYSFKIAKLLLQDKIDFKPRKVTRSGKGKTQ